MIVGNGTPRMAKAFDDEFHLRAVGAWVVTDESRATYAAAGFHRQWWRTLGPASIWHAIQLRRHGGQQKGMQGDGLQLGGAVVVAPDGRVVYRHLEGDIGDHAPASELTQALARTR